MGKNDSLKGGIASHKTSFLCHVVCEKRVFQTVVHYKNLCRNIDWFQLYVLQLDKILIENK